MNYSLNKIEKEFLYKKYIKFGMSPPEAYKNVKKLIDHLKFFVEKLRLKKKSEEEIEIKFKQEFEKLAQDLEGQT